MYVLGWLFTLAALAFLLLPAIIIVPISFSNSAMLDFPPRGLTLRWFAGLPNSGDWPSAAYVSLKIALATALITTAIALLLGLSHFLHGRLGRHMKTFFMLPVLIPHIILAVGIFDILVNTGGLGQISTLIFVNVAIALPLVAQLLLNAFDTVDPLLWTAGVSLGGPPRYVLRVLIIPLVSMSLVAALILAFRSAWDETTFAVFIGPPTRPPLASRLYSYLQENVTPEVAAVVTLLLLVTVIGAAIVVAINARQKARLLPPASE